MRYMRWPRGTRMRDVPGLTVTLLAERERERLVMGYLKYSYPPVVKNLNRSN